MIETLSQDAIIEILEVIEDEEFEKILRHAVSLPVNEKVKAVLEHLAHDDEADVAAASRQLLNVYTNKIR